MARTTYTREFREKAVALVFEHQDEYDTQWEAIKAISAKLNVSTETVRKWVRQAETDKGERPGTTSADQQKIRELQREVKELRRANEILKAASTFFARELDPQPPRS